MPEAARASSSVLSRNSNVRQPLPTCQALAGTMPSLLLANGHCATAGAGARIGHDEKARGEPNAWVGRSAEHRRPHARHVAIAGQVVADHALHRPASQQTFALAHQHLEVVATVKPRVWQFADVRANRCTGSLRGAGWSRVARSAGGCAATRLTSAPASPFERLGRSWSAPCQDHPSRPSRRRWPSAFHAPIGAAKEAFKLPEQLENSVRGGDAPLGGCAASDGIGTVAFYGYARLVP